MSARLQALLEEAAAAGTFPCARAVVRWRGRTVFSGGVGVPTVFDLASLTKPMATTAVFLSLWAEGKLEPDTPLARAFPESPIGRAGTTVADLLAHRSGLPAAEDMESAVRYLEALPYVQPGRTVIVGQSAGGWGSLAYSSRNPQGVVAIINFAGGRGGWAGQRPNTNCAPERLSVAAGKYGETARVPTLWIYTENDTFFAPEISRPESPGTPATPE